MLPVIKIPESGLEDGRRQLVEKERLVAGASGLESLNFLNIASMECASRAANCQLNAR